MKFVDSHTHLTSLEVLPHVDGVLERAAQSGVSAIVNICTDPASLQEGLRLAQRFPWIYNAGATTPHDVETEGESAFAVFERSAKEGWLAAVGETGLDYHYEHSNRSTQQRFLVRYLHLARDCELPAIFHCRDAFADLFAIADREYSGKAVLHCFTGSLDEAKRVVERGWMVSFSGIVTFKKSEALREVAKWVPMSHLLIETDTPYLAPQSRRGQQNEPAFIRETAECIAQVKGVSLDALASQSAANAACIFPKIHLKN